MANVTSTFPRILWSYYIQHLWNYNPESSVARIASAFRILALILILPILILSLLDVSSYVIARTLGIVDDVKASTSDRKTLHTMHPPPSIRIDSPKVDEPMVALLGDGGTLQILDIGNSQPSSLTPEGKSPDASPPEYFTSDLKLSGFDVFSPAPSQPPSPTLSRQQLPLDLQMSSVYQPQQDQLDEGIHFRRRKHGDSK